MNESNKLSQAKLGPLIVGMAFRSPSGEIRKIEEIRTGYVITDYLPAPLDFDELQPIPITPEILQDWFGIEVKWYHDGVWFFGVGYLELYAQGGSGIWINKGRFDPYHDFEIEHVHELQRLLAGLGIDHTAKIGGKDD